MPHRQLFCAAYRCGKTQRLAEAARSALESGITPQRMLALTVHRPAASVLRDRLHDVTGQAVPVTTVRRRALAILEDDPAAAHLPPNWSEASLLSGIDRRWLIRQAWAEAGPQSDSLFARRGALDWIALFFDRLSDWCGTADPRQLPALTIADAELSELWRAYAIYLDLCRRHGVVAFNEAINRARDALRHPDVHAAHARDVVLLDDFDLFQPAELLFVAALIHQTTDLYAACSNLPRSDSPLAIEHWRYQWVARHDMELVARDDEPRRRPIVSVGEYAAPDAEAHAIAQRIAADGSDHFDEYAIVAFDPELIPLLQRVLPQYGVPVQDQDARDGYTLAIAPLAITGLKLIAAQPPTLAETTAFLRHPAVGLSIEDAHAAVEAVTQRRFQPFAIDEPRWPSELWPTGRARLEEIRSVTAEQRTSTLPPSARLQHWLAALNLDARAWEQTEAALEPWAVALDRRHWERWLGFLVQSEALHAALGTPLSVDQAVEVFTSAQALVEAEGRPAERAVHISQPAALGGCSARLVFAAGLHEGALPQPMSPLPFADDAQLAEAFCELPGFVAPQINNQAASWERGTHDLRRALSRASEAAHLSYSRTDRQGRRRLPSPILAAATDAQVDRRGGLELADDTIERVLPAERDPITFAAIAARPVHLAQRSMIELPAPLPAMEPSADSAFCTSPSAIEDYFTCPRRCFYARILGLYDIASSPRQALGQVVHNALQDLLEESQVIPIDEARAAELIGRHWISDEHRWGTPLKQAVFRQLAEKAVAQMARYEADNGAGRTFVGGELDFEWTPADSNFVLRGRIDRIDRTAEGLEVIDYKLGQHSPSINALLSEFVPPRDAERAAAWRPGDIQLPVYALAIEQGAVNGLERLPGERVAKIALVYPLELYNEKGKFSAKGRREVEIVDHQSNCAACEAPPPARPKAGLICREQLAFVERQVRDAVALMRAGRWEPDPREGSRTCASCPFRPICIDPQ